MFKVQWNKKHTWKILKKYADGDLKAIQFEGVWYYPYSNYNCLDHDDCGNKWIGGDNCDECALRFICERDWHDHTVCDACAEANVHCICWR